MLHILEERDLADLGASAPPVVTIANAANPPPGGIITLAEQHFRQVNIIDPPPGVTYEIRPPRVDSFTTPHRLILRNNQPGATVRIAWPSHPGTSHGTDTAAGVPYEFFLCGDEEVVFDADLPSLSDWKILSGRHNYRQVLPLPSRKVLTTFGPSASLTWVNTGLSAKLAQKLQTRASIEEIRVEITVGSQNAGDQIALTLSHDGTTFMHDPSEVGLCAVEIIDPNQAHKAALTAAREGLTVGGLLPNCDPSEYTVWARMLRAGTAGSQFTIGRSYQDQSGTSFYKVGTTFEIREWADT